MHKRFAALGPYRLKTRGKVNARTFFPGFCRALARHGIGSVYVADPENLEQELLASQTIPTIVINLVHEIHDLCAYDVSDNVRQSMRALFNSYHTARIIRDKEKTNVFLSQNEIPVPSRDLEQGRMTFSNERIGTHAPVFVSDDLQEIDDARYNVRFIDTRQEFGGSEYYTSIRLMCIGPRLLQVFVRARDVKENNPSVHAADTPINRPLLDHLYNELVATRFEQYSSLAKSLGFALGPGFYAHDVLVDNSSLEPFVCETGFKFFDDAYWKRISSIVESLEFQYQVFPESAYAEYAGTEFVSYCREMHWL